MRGVYLTRAPRALPRRLSQSTAKKVLEENGWEQVASGNHQIKMAKAGELRPITLPQHRGQDYAVGLTNGIYRQAGLKGPSGDDEE